MIRSIARWSVENRVTVNILMVIILVAGVTTLFQIKREMFPQFSLEMIYVSVPYPGASPEEIEEGIVVKVEEAIKGVEGIKKLYSLAMEGMGSVVAELETNIGDSRKVLDDIETEVDRIETFPEEAKDPIIKQIDLKEPVIYVAVYGKASEITLRELAEKVRDDLTDTDAITQASLSGVRNYEISIEVSEANLRKYGLSFDEVARAVKAGSLDLPGGTIKTSDGELSLRAKGQRYTGREFESIPVRTLPDGAILRLGQVASIIDGFEDVDRWVRFNREPAVQIQILKTEEQDLLDIADTVHAYVEDHQDSLPSGVKMDVFFDQSTLVRSRLQLLVRNGRGGLLLVFLALWLFLQLRLSFWVSMGIPISIMGGLWLLGAKGDSLNMISLFAFIMVLGLVVDDAIIIGENIFTKYSRGMLPVQACVEGTAQVGWPVIMTILTTIAAFTPLFFVSGIMGKFIAVMPLAIIATLLFSLVEALIILPAHLAHSLEKQELRIHKKGGKNGKNRFRKLSEDTLKKVIDHYYSPILKWVLNNRYIGFAIAISILLIAIGMVSSGRVPFVLFSAPDSDWVVAKVIFPYGTSIETTESAIDQIEEAARKMNYDYSSMRKGSRNENIVQYTFSLVGEILPEGPVEGESGSHVGEIWLELLGSEKRNIHYSELTKRWRELTGEIPGTEKLEFTTPMMGPGGIPIEIKLIGNDYNELEIAAEELKKELAKYPGTFDISDDFRPGKPEIKLKTKPSAKVLGISMSDLAWQLRQGFYGDEALRIQRGRDDVKVMIRYTEAERRNRGSIENMRVRTPQGDEVPISYVADVEFGRGYSTIRRTDRQRTITVRSDIDEATGNAKEIVEDLKREFLSDLEEQYPSVTYSFAGQEETTQETFSSLGRGYLIALMVIYCLLATQFRSYIQPIIVMLAIPFGIIGAIVGHIVMGFPVTIMSLFGIVALSGIVVNDSLVLIDFVNQGIREDVPVRHAVYQAGRARFRAVLLTTITTVAGLFPILMERSFQAQFLIPMVTSITFGLVFATLLTLLLVPALYLILHDIIHLFTEKDI